MEPIKKIKNYGLELEVNYQKIARDLTIHEFSWDIERALEFALFRTYAVPSISGLLTRTGEFTNRPQKRYDDTELILSEILENGFESERGRVALALMNDMHGRFRITNDDMLYVLSTFVFEPIRWINKFGRRPMTENETLAWLEYHSELGRRMGIVNIPTSLDEFESFNRNFEEARFSYSKSNFKIGSTTRDLFLSFYLPKWLIPAGRPVAHAFMDEPLLRAMGFPIPPEWLKRITIMVMRFRRTILRWLPPRRRPRRLTEVQRATYPEGYKIEELGTLKCSRPQRR
ncbi:DUF2236 domain-containing protein [Paracoccus liaowanqingii]|uniref:DUF2236 domain-containing protein n=1 Tax=Paracoccus liaowanqingii TaxID=2560053 RepID=A0A4Z1CJV1_9RHOB|nr:oxygenase MpaB family protein [Paracoccus liaowanqingii]TGN42437.1 DUF2236 domain-containing protein [Paracoccus liaowanqingii]